MPDSATVYRWLEKHFDFRAKYLRARELQADFLSAQIIEIADTCREGVKTEQREVGRRCSMCGQDLRWKNGGWAHSVDGHRLCAGASAEKVIETRTTTGDMVDRSRLQVDARKWYASKLAPKKYGDRLEVEVSAELTHREVTRDALRKLTPEELELYENLLAKVNQAAIGSAGG